MLPPPPPKKSRTTLIVLAAVVGGLVSCLLGVTAVALVFKDSIPQEWITELAAIIEDVEPGDCLNDVHFQPYMEIVDCDAPEARYRVLGLDDTKTWGDMDYSCRDFSGVSYRYFVDYELPLEDATTGTFLCLKRLNG